MPKYKYKAIDQNGKYSKGKIFAENPADLESLIKSSNLDLISYQAEKEGGLFNKTESLTNKELITLFVHLEQLDKAGVTIIEAISDVKESAESPVIKNLMQEVYESVKNGSLFSEALAKHPKIFNSVFIGLITSGEKTGNLHSSFASLVSHLKWSAEMRRKTVKAIRYPMFSLVVMLIVVGIMTVVVVPKVTSFLSAQDIALPMMTKSLIAFSNFFRTKGLFVIVSIILLFFVYKALYKLPNFALQADKVKLKLPVFGDIITKLEVSKFCYFFGMTFKSGLGVLDCLESAKSVIGNLAIKQSIDLVKQQVSSGQSIAKSISYTGYFPSLVVRMFKVGEESGNMESSLDNIRFFYDQEINDGIDRIVGMIQPSLTFIMGGMMAWITIAVFGPIYGSFSKF